MWGERELIFYVVKVGRLEKGSWYGDRVGGDFRMGKNLSLAFKSLALIPMLMPRKGSLYPNSLNPSLFTNTIKKVLPEKLLSMASLYQINHES